MTFAQAVRQFFRELFGSRMTEHLLSENAFTVTTYESRINDLKQQLADLKLDKQLLQVKIAQLEQAVLPYASRAGADLARLATPGSPKPVFTGQFEDTPKTSWQKAQEEFEALENESAAKTAGV